MKHLFDAARVQEVQARMAQLRPESAALWGTMNPAQALAHCALGARAAETLATTRIRSGAPRLHKS